MLDLTEYSRKRVTDYYGRLEEISQRPFPRTAEEMMKMEQELYKSSAIVADQLLLEHLIKAHNDKEFVEEAIDQARKSRSVALIGKGWQQTSVLLTGGSRVIIKTPYLREDLRQKRGRKRRKRGKKGSGVYPVLEKLGIRDGVSPSTRSEIALHTVQAASYQEAVDLLRRRGFDCDISTLVRIASATAQADISLRDAALEAAMNIPIPAHSPLSGKRVRVSIDGGRVRTRRRSRGRKTSKGRAGFTTPWREPRVMVIDLLDEQGKPDQLRLPLYDTLLDDAEASFNLLIGYLRLFGAAHAEIVEFIADGADWIWDRVERLISQAEIPQSRLVQVIDFYHASEHLAKAVDLCRSIPKKQRSKLYENLRHSLRHDTNGVAQVMEQLNQLSTTRRGKKMKKALLYFEKNSARMNYAELDKMKLPVGSGQVESAVRRVINLRFKSPGSFWNEKTVNGLMHLRAYFKAGRWDELIKRVLSKTFLIPSFDPIQRKSVSVSDTATSREVKKAA